MSHRNVCVATAGGVLVVFWLLTSAAAAQNMPGMSAMENTIGFLSSGTAIEPKRTSESGSMLQASVRDWTLMVHGNAFILDT